MMERDLIDALLGTMDDSSSDVVTAVCSVLLSLINSHPTNRIKLLEAGAVDVITEVLEDYPIDDIRVTGAKDVQRCGKEVLQQLQQQEKSGERRRSKRQRLSKP